MKKFFLLSYIFVILFSIAPKIFSQPVVNLLWEKVANVRTMEFSPNGQFLVTGGSITDCYPYICGQIKIWNIADSALIRTLTNPNLGLTNDVAFFSSGISFTSGHGSIYCPIIGECSPDKPGQFQWDFGSGDILRSDTDPDGIIQTVDISPDQTLIASGVNYDNVGKIRIFDVNYNLVRTLEGHDEGTTSVEFSPDGHFLVSGGHDGFVKVWDISTGVLIRTMFHGTFLSGGRDVEIDISPNGNLIASAGQGFESTIKIWSFDGVLLHTILIDELDGFNKISFTPNGLYLGCGSIVYGLNGTGWYGLIRFYKVSDGEIIEQYADYTGSPISGGIRSIAFSSSGNHYFAYSISSRLRIASVNINLVTPTSIEPASNAPDFYQLFNNYPNPFNPATKIKFNIPQSNNGSEIFKIIIYDLTGKELTRLLNGPLAPGQYEVTFDGTNYPSGTYFYKFESDNFSDVKKMVLVK